MVNQDESDTNIFSVVVFYSGENDYGGSKDLSMLLKWDKTKRDFVEDHVLE